MRKFILGICLVVVYTTGWAQPKIAPKAIAPEVNPIAAGFNVQRLNRIDAALQKYVDDQRLNGVVALVIRNGHIAYYKSFGYADMETKSPMKNDAIFRIASQTKAITSVAVMMLYEEGKFLLDDPISDYIPEFKNPKVLDKLNLQDTTWTTVPAKREITIRDLLTHTSGIGYAQIGSAEARAIYHKGGVLAGIGVGKIVLADQIKLLAKLPLLHQPGEKWTYGLNTDVLGYLVEVVSGMPLDRFFQERIFKPLGMNDTYFFLPKEKHHRLVTLYGEDEKTGKLVKTKDTIMFARSAFTPHYPKTAGTHFSGGGGLSSTIYDYAIFLQMLLNGGEYNGTRLLSRNSVRMMTTNQAGDLYRQPNHFGLGFGITTEKGSSILPTQEGTFEWGGMFATTYWVDPKENMVALLYRNVYPTSLRNIANQFKVLVYSAIND